MSPANHFHALVTMALADGRLAAQERDLLLRCAEWLGISRNEAAWVLSRVLRGHGPDSVLLPTDPKEQGRLFNGLVNVAVADGVVSPSEERCLQGMARSFGIDPGAVAPILRRARDLATHREWPPGWAEQAQIASSSARLEVGSVVADRFELKELLGVGGFGRVYRARHTDLGEDVALKVLRLRLEGDAQAEERFRTEVKLARSFAHRYAVAMREFGRDRASGCLYFTMDLVEGFSLDTTLDHEGTLAAGRAIRLCRQVLSALEEAHDQGLIHRDLKPANIMLTRGRSGEEEVRLLDFGIARVVQVTESGDTSPAPDEPLVGTLAYMSPEQAGRRRLDARSDLYAMGVVLYELLSGHLPIEADLDTDDVQRSFLSRILHKTPQPLDADVPPRLRHVVRVALEKEPERRFQSAAQFSEALERANDPRQDTSRFTRWLFRPPQV